LAPIKRTKSGRLSELCLANQQIASGDYTEKAGVGGSTPSLATIVINDLENEPKNFYTYDFTPVVAY